MAFSVARRAAGVFSPKASAPLWTPRRHLNVHEYISMSLMQEYGVPVPRSSVATTAEEAEHAFVTKFPGGGMCAPPRACYLFSFPSFCRQHDDNDCGRLSPFKSGQCCPMLGLECVRVADARQIAAKGGNSVCPCLCRGLMLFRQGRRCRQGTNSGWWSRFGHIY